MVAVMAHYLALLQQYQLCNNFMEIGVIVAQILFLSSVTLKGSNYLAVVLSGKKLIRKN